MLPSTCIYIFQVSFIGEDGDDSGGLTREFFTLLPKEILNQFMEPTGVFRHNAVALQVKLVYRVEKLCVCFPYKCESYESPLVSELPDLETYNVTYILYM